jgi:hypothetical protein
VYTESNDLRAQLLDDTCTSTGPTITVSNASGTQNQAASALVGGQHVVVFIDARLSVQTLYMQRIAPDGSMEVASILNELLVAETTSVDEPAIASSGPSALVVWSRDGNIEASVITP